MILFVLNRHDIIILGRFLSLTNAFTIPTAPEGLKLVEFTFSEKKNPLI